MAHLAAPTGASLESRVRFVAVLVLLVFGGFIVRLGVIVLVIALLQQTEWFSIVAFIAALIPATVGLLVVEMKLLSGRMQADLWVDPDARREVAP